ncbi:hypothetical protein F5888DRAFT_1635000 [Russula emetica]|nr:hypothetical protein F5888DRAFT_1635000 [Russula emetica]
MRIHKSFEPLFSVDDIASLRPSTVPESAVGTRWLDDRAPLVGNIDQFLSITPERNHLSTRICQNVGGNSRWGGERRAFPVSSLLLQPNPCSPTWTCWGRSSYAPVAIAQRLSICPIISGAWVPNKQPPGQIEGLGLVWTALWGTQCLQMMLKGVCKAFSWSLSALSTSGRHFYQQNPLQPHFACNWGCFEINLPRRSTMSGPRKSGLEAFGRYSTIHVMQRQLGSAPFSHLKDPSIRALRSESAISKVTERSRGVYKLNQSKASRLFGYIIEQRLQERQAVSRVSLESRIRNQKRASIRQAARLQPQCWGDEKEKQHSAALSGACLQLQSGDLTCEHASTGSSPGHGTGADTELKLTEKRRKEEKEDRKGVFFGRHGTTLAGDAIEMLCASQDRRKEPGLTPSHYTAHCAPASTSSHRWAVGPLPRFSRFSGWS